MKPRQSGKELNEKGPILSRKANGFVEKSLWAYAFFCESCTVKKARQERMIPRPHAWDSSFPSPDMLYLRAELVMQSDSLRTTS